jgi:hypothetical protein
VIGHEADGNHQHLRISFPLRRVTLQDVQYQAGPWFRAPPFHL